MNKLNFLWDTTYSILKNKLQAREINDIIIPFYLINLQNNYSIIEQYSSKFSLDDVINSDTNINACDRMLNYYAGLSEGLKKDINEFIKSYRFYNFEEICIFLSKENLLIDIVKLVNSYIISIEKVAAIIYIKELISYGNYKHSHKEVIRKQNDTFDSFVFCVDDKYEAHENYYYKYVDFPDMACVWDFSEGYARCLTRSGQWGYIKEDDSVIILLPTDYVRVWDFHCGRAKVELLGKWEGWENKQLAYGFIDLNLNLVIEAKYTSATKFNNKVAFVQSEYCNKDYQIDVYGNVSEDFLELKQETEKKTKEMEIEFQREIKELGEKIIAETEIKLREEETIKNNKPLRYIGDPESEIMSALRNGDGDIYGF